MQNTQICNNVANNAILLIAVSSTIYNDVTYYIEIANKIDVITYSAP